MRRVAVAASWAGLLGLQVAVAVAYLNRGTWWHYLLHQMVGWGAGLALAAVVATVTRYRVPAVVALLTGQLISIAPDLLFVYAGMPHTRSMDVYLGHVSIHTAPSPMLVALACVLLGGWAFVAAELGRRRAAGVLAVAAVAVVTVASVLAAPIPTTLAEFPTDAPPAASGPAPYR